ncbi:MAG: cation diffusion facilitator family transporter [bacterium]
MNFKALLDPLGCTLVGLVVNIGLTVFKFIAAVMGESDAMLADSMHSLSDVAATAIVYFGIRIARRPADECHPYGHGGFDTVVATGVTLVLLATGVLIGIKGMSSIHEGDATVPKNLALYAALISILVKEGLFHYTIKVGKKNKVNSLIANAWDHRSDAYSSIVALVGIGTAKLGLRIFDPIAALVIAYLIVRTAMHLLKDYVKEMVHEAPPREDVERISEVVSGIDGVRGVSNVRVHRIGPEVFVDLDVIVNKDISVASGHAIATEVREELKKRLERVGDVMVHIEPDS